MTPSPFDPLSRLDPPDLWPEIERRAATVPVAAPTRRRYLPAAAAVAVVVALVGAALAWAGAGDDDADQVATAPTDLTCRAEDLVAGSIPDDASAGSQVRTWTEDGLAVELQVPAPLYYDFFGERTEAVSDPDGTLYYRSDGAVLFLVEAPCDYQLTVSGGDDAPAHALVLRIASRLRWRVDPGVTECGPLSPWAMHVVEGPTAATALVDPGFADLLLQPDADRIAAWRPDGRCEFHARTRGGLEPMVVVSGSGGTYGVDYIAGFAPVSVALPAEPTPPLSVSIAGRSFSVRIDFWCDACVRTRVALLYPDDDIVAAAESTEPRGFVEGSLPGTPTPGTHGILVVTVEAENGDLRGVHAIPIESGDFAAS